MAESFNLSVGAMGSGERPGRLKSLPKIISLDEALEVIGGLPVSADQKSHLSSVARKSPNGALGNLVQNYKNHLKKS